MHATSFSSIYCQHQPFVPEPLILEVMFTSHVSHERMFEIANKKLGYCYTNAEVLPFENNAAILESVIYHFLL